MSLSISISSAVLPDSLLNVKTCNRIISMSSIINNQQSIVEKRPDYILCIECISVYHSWYRALHNICMTVRGALLIQLYIRIDRLDLAEKHLKVMKSADEDSTLSMLASAWIALSSVSLTSPSYRTVPCSTVQFSSSPQLLSSIMYCVLLWHLSQCKSFLDASSHTL